MLREKKYFDILICILVGFVLGTATIFEIFGKSSRCLGWCQAHGFSEAKLESGCYCINSENNKHIYQEYFVR